MALYALMWVKQCHKPRIKTENGENFVAPIRKHGADDWGANGVLFS